MSDGWITLHGGYGVDEKTIMLPVEKITVIEEWYGADGWKTRVICDGITAGEAFRVNERAEEVRRLIGAAREGNTCHEHQ